MSKPVKPAPAATDSKDRMLAAAAVPAVGIAFWVTSAKTITAWALRNDYFTTANPIVALPGSRPPGAGPTPLAALAFAATAIGVAAAIILAVKTFTTPIQQDPDDRRPLPPVTTPVVAAAALSGGAITLGLIPLFPQLLAATIGIVIAIALGDWLLEKMRAARTRARFLNEIEWVLYPYLGFDELPRKRIVAITEWDPPTDTHPEKPKTIVLAYKGRREELKPELGRRLDDAVGSHFTLSYATTDQLITANLASINAEPQQVRDLRDQLATTALFESGATLHDPEFSESTGDLTRFVVHHGIGAKLSGTDRLQGIERKIGDLLPGRWRAVNINHLAGTATFELRPELPTRVYTPAMEASTSVAQACERYPGSVIPLAVDENLNHIEWNLEVNPHLLLMGPTGTGKTATIQNTIIGGALLGARIFIIDFKGGEFTRFRDYPNVVSVLTEPHEAVALVNILYREMRTVRYGLYKRDRRALANKEPFLIIFDEYTEFQDIIKRFYNTHKGKAAQRDCPTLEQFSSLLRLGRTCRFHCVAALQRADQKFLEGEAKDNFTQRLSLGRLSTQAAIMIHNDAFAGRTVPLGIRGRGTALNRHGVPTEVQSFYVPDPDSKGFGHAEQEILADLLPPVSLYERGIIMPPPSDPVSEPEDFAVYQNLPLLKAAEYPAFDPVSPQYAPPHWLEIHDAGIDSIYGQLPPSMRPTTPEELVSTVYESDDDEGHIREVKITDLQIGDYLCNPNTGDWAILDEEPIHDADDPTNTILVLRDNYSGDREEAHIGSTESLQVREIPETHLTPA